MPPLARSLLVLRLVVVMLLRALKLILPPLPLIELALISPVIVLIAPLLLVRLIVPPPKEPVARICPVVIFPEACKVVLPPNPVCVLVSMMPRVVLIAPPVLVTEI